MALIHDPVQQWLGLWDRKICNIPSFPGTSKPQHTQVFRNSFGLPLKNKTRKGPQALVVSELWVLRLREDLSVKS
jgi:hypothetical protein